MKQKLLTMILFTGLTVSVLAGCGQTETASLTDTTAETTEATKLEESEQAEEVTPEAEETEVASVEEPETTTEPNTEEVTQESTEESVDASEPTEEPAPTSAEEPTPEYTYTELNKTMYASSAVNLRDLPSTDGNKMGGLNVAEEVTVLAQCNETSWYKILYNDAEVFVSNEYLVNEKPAEEVAQASNGNTSTTSNVPNPYELPLQTWVDFGDWFLYIQPSLECPEYNVDGAFWQDKVAILRERHPAKQVASGLGIKLDNGTYSAWAVSTYDGISADGTHGVGYPQAHLDFIKLYQY